MSKDRVLRHTAVVRLCHWAIALSGFLLCFSGIGFMPLYGRFFVNELPGLHWASNFAVQMQLHYLSAMVFMTAGAFHLLYHWRRGEMAAWPKRGDLKESWLIVRAMLTGGEEPDHGKFLAEQRIAYAVIAAASLLLTATGIFLAWKSTIQAILDPTLIQIVTLTHQVTTFLFMALIALHLAAFLLKTNHPLLPSMVTGRVDKGYARRRHAKWDTES